MELLPSEYIRKFIMSLLEFAEPLLPIDDLNPLLLIKGSAKIFALGKKSFSMKLKIFL